MHFTERSWEGKRKLLFQHVSVGSSDPSGALLNCAADLSGVILVGEMILQNTKKESHTRPDQKLIMLAHSRCRQIHSCSRWELRNNHHPDSQRANRLALRCNLPRPSMYSGLARLKQSPWTSCLGMDRVREAHKGVGHARTSLKKQNANERD